MFTSLFFCTFVINLRWNIGNIVLYFKVLTKINPIEKSGYSFFIAESYYEIEKPNKSLLSDPILITLDSWFSNKSFSFISESCDGKIPFSSGIGSPWGSNLGWFKKVLNLSVKIGDFICSNCSAMSWTSSHLNASFSTKNVSQRRCFLITDMAKELPKSVNELPLYFSYLTFRHVSIPTCLLCYIFLIFPFTFHILHVVMDRYRHVSYVTFF